MQKRPASLQASILLVAKGTPLADFDARFSRIEIWWQPGIQR